MGLKILKLFSVLLGTSLLIWGASFIVADDLIQIIKSLTLSQLVFWAGLNIFIMIILGVRWHFILTALGYSIPFVKITRYRLTAFAISYFTPGPHFGGEPYQVIVQNKNHGIPLHKATASIALDKLFDLVFNFSFLILGISILISNNFNVNNTNSLWLLLIAIIILPFIYLYSLKRGKYILSSMLLKFPTRKNPSNWFGKIVTGIIDAEKEMARFFLLYTGVTRKITIISILIWVLLIIEYWVGLLILGVDIGIIDVIILLTFIRLAMLTPIPGAFGALEASQVFAMQSLGIDLNYAFGISLLIRSRDVFFGLLGLSFMIARNKNLS